MTEHGPRLGEEEYAKLVVALHSDLPPVPSRKMREAVRRRELDLTIDHRLGQAFPCERRERLWEIQRNVNRRRWRIGLGLVAHVIVGGPKVAEADRLSEWVVDQYRQELSEPELEAYLGAETVAHPTLPTIDDHAD
jgi:hypothetical protein